MTKVINFLIGTANLKTHKAILMGRSNAEFFRGVNFHIAVLQNADKIMKMIPSFIADGTLTEIKTIDDSIRLGNFMILTKNIVTVVKDPRFGGNANEKIPK